MVVNVLFRKLSPSPPCSLAEKVAATEAVAGTAERRSKRRIQPSFTSFPASSTATTAAGMRTICLLSIAVVALLSSSSISTGTGSLFCYGLSPTSTSHRNQRHQQGAPLATTTFRSTPSSSTTLVGTTSTTSLSAVSSTHTAVLDGSEWTSVQRHLTLTGSDSEKQQLQNRNKDETNMGLLTIVTGTLLQGNDAESTKGRVVAVQAHTLIDDDDEQQQRPVQYISDSVAVFSDSVATIPSAISDAQAAATYAQSVSWHTAWQQAVSANKIGGDTADTNTAFNGTPIKAVVVGGSAYATTAAAALAALGATVTVVSTGTPKLSGGGSTDSIQSLPPATGELEVSFCNVLGKFDLLLDTIGNERDDDVGSSVLRFLKDRHDCHSYTSTVTAAQAIVNRQGVLWGPGKAKQHQQDLLKVQETTGRSGGTSQRSFTPPAHLGRTVQTILQAGVVAPKGKGGGGLLVRDWSLPDYWELVTWPRDSAGGANVRFGFPVPDDLSLVFEDGMDYDYADGGDSDSQKDALADMISAPPLRAGRVEEETMQASETPEGSNPYILNVVGVQGLQKHVIESERDCLLFLSAPFCRTCRYLQPQYQRMARMGTEEWDGAVTFAKADAGGAVGKELGRALQVDAVPSFLLFRKGKLYGEPLSISRLPSRKLDLAVDLMKSGKPWDEQALREVDQEGSKKNPRRPPNKSRP